MPPINDNFADAIVLSGTSGQVTGSNVAATKETGEPNNPASNGGASVWWSWTATTTENVTINLSGSSYDTILAVYTGTAVNALTLIASDDDSGDGTTSKLTFAATSGITYKICVDGYGGATGSIVLTWNTASICLLSATIASAAAMPNAGQMWSNWIFLSATPASAAAITGVLWSSVLWLSATPASASAMTNLGVLWRNPVYLETTIASASAMTGEVYLPILYLATTIVATSEMITIGIVVFYVYPTATIEVSSEMRPVARNRTPYDDIIFTGISLGVPYRPNDYDANKFWDEETQTWIDSVALPKRAGGRQKEYLIVVGCETIYVGGI